MAAMVAGTYIIYSIGIVEKEETDCQHQPSKKEGAHKKYIFIFLTDYSAYNFTAIENYCLFLGLLPATII